MNLPTLSSRTTLAIVLMLVCMAGTVQAAEAVNAMPETCAAKLKASDEAKALADVKLAEEYERSDAQVYLMRLELSVTKRALAAALAKCGAACTAPAAP